MTKAADWVALKNWFVFATKTSVHSSRSFEFQKAFVFLVHDLRTQTACVSGGHDWCFRLFSIDTKETALGSAFNFQRITKPVSRTTLEGHHGPQLETSCYKTNYRYHPTVRTTTRMVGNEFRGCVTGGGTIIPMEKQPQHGASSPVHILHTSGDSLPLDRGALCCHQVQTKQNTHPRCFRRNKGLAPHRLR